MRAPLFALIVSILLGGCASLERGPARDLTLENSWVRSTKKSEFLGFRRMNRMSPLLLDTMLVQGNSIDGITAYDRSSGRQLWRIDLINGVEGGVTAVGDRLYFGSSNGQFYCASLKDGRVLWTFQVHAETLAPPSVDAGIVYFQSGTDVVYALDAETGKQLWLYNRQVSASLSIRATTRPMVVGEQVLVGFSDGFLVALRKRDGVLNWERKLGKSNRFHDVDSTPVVDGSNVYVSSFDAALYSLKVDTGEINWVVEDGGYVPVTLGEGRLNDRLFYATAGSKIYVVEKATGKIMKTIPVEHGIPTQPTLYKGYLVYGESEGSLIVADALSGATLAHFEPGDGFVARPAIADGQAYFISNDANLYSVKLSLTRASDRLPWQTSL